MAFTNTAMSLGAVPVREMRRSFGVVDVPDFEFFFEPGTACGSACCRTSSSWRTFSSLEGSTKNVDGS